MTPNQALQFLKSNIGFGLVGLIWVLVCSGIPFFWDAITLGSQTAAHFTENGLGALILPENLDAGHPPLFGWYLAAVSGNNLFFNHLAMWPFLFLIWTQYYRYCARFLQGGPLIIAMLLLFIEPTLLAQSIHVAPDLMLLAFFLLALNAILDRKTTLLVLALSLLCLSGLRGCIGSAALWFLALYINSLEAKRLFSTFTLLPWVISTLLVFSWFAYHYSQTGWLLANPDSPWGDNQGFSGLQGMLRNIGIAGWRVLDFGRFALWIPGLYFIFRTRKKNEVLLAGFLIPLLLFTATFIPFSNPIAHRYYLPVLILFIPWLVFQLSELSIVRRNTIVGIAALLLISGHFWVYPDKVAQGWDGSLAHLPYFELRKTYLFELEDEKDVYTDFPMNKNMWDSNPGYKIKGNYKAAGKVESSWLDYDYVVYSNIINDISEEEYDIITSTWILEKELKKGQIFIREYKNPNR